MKRFWQKDSADKGGRSPSAREKSLRYHPRTPANGLVRIRSTNEEFSGYLVNISNEGLMSRARNLPDPHEKVTLSFRLLPSREELQVQGVVVWAAPQSEPDWFRRMGVRFLDPGEKERKLIRKYVSRYSAPA